MMAENNKASGLDWFERRQLQHATDENMKALTELVKARLFQSDRFEAERKEFAEKAHADMERARADKTRWDILIAEARAELAEIGAEVKEAGERLNALRDAKQEIEIKVVVAEATKREAETEIERTREIRQQLESALASLRAYPSAKIEAWMAKRQASDPEVIPRFPELTVTYSGVSG